MAYPKDGAPKTEILIDGVWVDISSRVRGEGGREAIKIVRGRTNQQSRLSPQHGEFTINNRDGLFSNRNPTSAYFRKLPRNTQLRISAGTGDTYLRLPTDMTSDVTSRASTPDTATLDIVGDIELRVEIFPYSWRPMSGGMILLTKYRASGNQRSWALSLNPQGFVTLIWSPDGINNVAVQSDVAIPATTGKLAIKATLDVVDGANKTVRFFTASSIDGTYTQLGTTKTTPGTTSIYSSSVSVCVGQGDSSTSLFTGWSPFRGRFYKARVYDGIGGTVRTNPDFTVQALGATSFVDSNGLTWSMTGKSRITSDRLRIWGELSSLPQSWDKSGRDVWVNATVSGLSRRLIQGKPPLQSPIFRALSGRSLTSYFTMEDGSQSTSAATFVESTKPAAVTDVAFASENDLPGAKTSAQFTSNLGRFIGVPLSTAATGTAYFTFYFKLSSLPAVAANFVKLTTSGTARTIYVLVNTGSFTFQFWDSDGTVLSSSTVAFGGADMIPTGRWMAMNILLTASGGNVSWTARWSNVAAETFVGSVPLLFAGTVGRFVNIDIRAANSASFTDLAFAHVHTSTSDLDFVNDDLAKAANAYLGETAANRILRLGREENVAVEITGDPVQTETMGYQGVKTFFDLFLECANADGGIPGESRDSLALTYRTRIDLEHRSNVILNYGNEELSEIPQSVEDDDGVMNDVTVTREGGSSGRREITSGYMSVNDPPNGIGRYSTDETLNVELDSRLTDIASWIANASSRDEARYPNISVAMHRSKVVDNADLLLKMLAADLGDTAVLTTLPGWIPPEDVYSLIQGYTERMGKRTWDWVANTTPAGTYDTGRYDYETERGRTRWGHAGSTLAADINTSTTTILLASAAIAPTTAVATWTVNAASYPFEIMLDGEVIRLNTAPTGSTTPQTFNGVTRGVNGVLKNHYVGMGAQLLRVSTYRL